MNRISTKQLENIISMIDNKIPCGMIREDLSSVLKELIELRTLCEKQSAVISSQCHYIEKYIDGRD